MAHIPDYVIIKPAKTAQNWCYGIATFLSFVSIGGFSNGDGGFGFLAALMAFGLFYGGSKIKTKKWLRGRGGIYQ